MSDQAKNGGNPGDEGVSRTQGKSPLARASLWIRQRRTGVIVALSVTAAFFLGFGLRGGSHSHPSSAAHPSAQTAEVEPLFWTCSMHPQVRSDDPRAKCPLCAMDLIPVYPDGGSELGPRSVRLSESARMLARVQTSAVERRTVERELRLVGRIDYDERRLVRISAWVSGRIERLHVDFTGQAVAKGEPLLDVYSPELVAAQEEFLQAIRVGRELEPSSSETLRRTAVATMDSARSKLSLLGLDDEQIGDIARRGSPSLHVTIRAPASGIVIEKPALEGAYVETGAPLYAIADFSQVWALFEAFESDLRWVREGQAIAIAADAFREESFQGVLTFVDPTLDERTRTVRLRADVPNPDGRLRPGMFVRGALRSELTDGGLVAEPGEPGDGRPPLVIPVTAPLLTGTRAVVYVEDQHEEGVYTGREVELGPRAGGYYVVLDGLSEGERVVTRGAFKIDSSLQILGKQSMMSPEGGAPPPGHQHGPAAPADPHEGHSSASQEADAQSYVAPQEFLASLEPVYDAYVKVSDALAADDLARAKAAAGELLTALRRPDMRLLTGDAHDFWMERSESAATGLSQVERARTIEAARNGFKTVSDALISVARGFGPAEGATLHVLHCPMAFGDRGADWLSRSERILNPYFGASMLRCGEVRQTLGGSTAGEADCEGCH